ncbi:MAG: hypothetical protein U9R53_07610 [Chloroflexota bacterium]|nr:hypothetical protein [Chloroflexota bacterium]
MKLSEIIQLVNGKLLTEPISGDVEIAGAMGADLMSDVLASIRPESVLLTGLCNPQVIRTASIADIHAVVFVRGKSPAKETIEIANEDNIPLIKTNLSMYDACGILYENGLPGYESSNIHGLA